MKSPTAKDFSCLCYPSSKFLNFFGRSDNEGGDVNVGGSKEESEELYLDGKSEINILLYTTPTGVAQSKILMHVPHSNKLVCCVLPLISVS